MHCRYSTLPNKLFEKQDIMIREKALDHGSHIYAQEVHYVFKQVSGEGNLVVTVVSLVIATILAVSIAILDHSNVVGTIA